MDNLQTRTREYHHNNTASRFTVSYLDGRLGASAGLLPEFTFDDFNAALTKYTELVNEARDAVIIDGNAAKLPYDAPFFIALDDEYTRLRGYNTLKQAMTRVTRPTL